MKYVKVTKNDDPTTKKKFPVRLRAYDSDGGDIITDVVLTVAEANYSARRFYAITDAIEDAKSK